ncbi:hypothetical protein D1825_06325 [Cellulomonas rhizosphaerae]|uniref:Glycosyltransferase n=1 Tax=Cellulomonas rhizosphaerae TaxID=2293719 RepID=A0A413RN77_9CELL|nr:hypothetical protein D1825_06325 [Cellulomonas rhizosphaerae]
MHGHYRDWFDGVPRSEAVTGRIGYTGLVRRYKNVVGLVTAFRAARADDPSLSLLVAGKPSGVDIEDEVRRAASPDPAIALDLHFLDDDALVAAITSSELVALPYRHMHNSGSALLALSLDRPVLVPVNDVNADLAREVGAGWVHTFDGELDGESIHTALRASRAPRSTRPDLTARDWDAAGQAHLEAYRLALRLRRSHRS